MKEAEDIKRAAENVEAARAKIKSLEEEVQRDTQRIAESFGTPPAVERLALAPKRGQAVVHFVALGWLPEDADVRS